MDAYDVTLSLRAEITRPILFEVMFNIINTVLHCTARTPGADWQQQCELSEAPLIGATAHDVHN